ncbi:DUF3040 domain-containing protein [Luteimicrobium sp. NPDC057192]|uniref:DUF3040 domain-containing protein n=1 Tax=Luteimicrobium sp. NPDC057192 TaxID=3346042 RepID=UPI0036365854
MPLSEYEQRVLEQMEQALTSDDPRLANTLQSAERHPLWRYVVGFLAAAAGLLVLVLGAAASQWWLGVGGFVLMFAGVAFALLRRKARSGPIGVVGGTHAAPQSRPTASATKRESFLARLEERWERRRHEGGR